MEDDILEKFEIYLDEKYTSDEERNTQKAYLSDIKLFLKYFEDEFGEKLVSFSRGHILEYKNYMLNKMNYKFSTINRKLASISVYEDFLIENNIKESKDIKKRDSYKIDLPYISADMLPRKTIKKLRLEASKSNIRDYALIVLIDEAGLRVSEAIKIQLERDVNLDMRRITIFGKGRKVREVFINNEIYDALEEYIRERNEILEKLNVTNKYLFISNKSKNTGKHIDRSTVNKMLNKYCEKLNEKNLHPHILRHDFATTRYEEGFSDMRLKKSLGQSSSVVNRYVHPGGEENRNN